MPPRHAYWTILIDDQPTAFRAHDAEELLPTLNRLREKNASAVMKWFERGKLFDSRDEARDAGLGQGERRWEGPRPERDDEGPRFAERPPGERTGRDRPTRDQVGPRGETRPKDKNWRPGGEHRDPRQKYKDAKKAKWNRFKDKIRERHDDRTARSPESFTPPHGDKLRDQHDQREQPQRPRPTGPREPWAPGPAAKPHGDQLRARPPRPEWRRDDDRRGSADRSGNQDRRPSGDRPPRRDANREQRPWSDRPPRRDDTREGRPWSDRPPRRDDTREGRPWSDRPPRRDDTREGRPWSERPPRRENDRDRSPSSDRPQRRDDRERSGYRGRQDPGGWRPTGPGDHKPAGGGWPGANQRSGESTGGRKPWGGKPAGGARKPWGGKPTGSGFSKSSDARGARKPWESKPPGRRPAGDRPPKRRRDDE